MSTTIFQPYRHPRQWTDRSRTVGHTGFFRGSMREPLWQPTLDWLLAQIAAPAPACGPAGVRQ